VRRFPTDYHKSILPLDCGISSKVERNPPASELVCIYVFASDKDPDVVGFTSDEVGSNLPVEHGPWREEIEPGIEVIDTDDDPIAQAVRLDGFYVSTGYSDC
jgi:hypothetical protein